jgi:hypothetical protein
MKRMNEIHSKQVRRRSDGSIDIEFYRRHAVTLRGELIARSLSVTCREVRHWAATTTWLVRRGGRLIVTMARDASGELFKTANNHGHRV